MTEFWIKTNDEKSIENFTKHGLLDIIKLCAEGKTEEVKIHIVNFDHR